MCTSEHNLNMFQPETMWEIVFRVLNCIALRHSKPSRRASLMVVAFLPWVQSVVQRAPAKRSLPARLLKWYDGNHIPRDQSKFIFFQIWWLLVSGMPCVSNRKVATINQQQMNLIELRDDYLRLPGILSSLVDALQRKRRGPRLPQSCGHFRPAAKAVKWRGTKTQIVPNIRRHEKYSTLHRSSIICQKANQLVLVSKSCTVWKCINSKYFPNSKRREMPRATPPVRPYLCPPRRWT